MIDVSFDGVVSKVSAGRVTANAYVKIVWETSGESLIVARVLDGQWATARTSGGIKKGSILRVSTGAGTDPED